jgi:predicted 3-demethylubiquinone-9 3-methyltransferase (glyoxalase superfamily)
MPTITTFLMFNDKAEEAVRHYLSIFEDGEVTSTMPGPNGTVMGVNFELFGRSFIALNGGPSFSFSEAMSLFVEVETQAEIDRFWSKLTSDGGAESRCGWCKDKYGVSWQIIPKALGQFLSDNDRVKAGRAMQAMMQMGKIDIAVLKAAFSA